MSGEKNDVCVIDCGGVAVRHDGGWLMAESLIEPIPMTILAVVSDDPDSWDEMMALWPRHRTPAVPESLSSIRLESVTREQVLEAFADDPFFMVIDLCQKKLATGAEYPETRGDMRFITDETEFDKTRYTMGFHLPPWWELAERVPIDEALAERVAPAVRPKIDREFLYGETVSRAFAAALIEAYELESVREKSKASGANGSGSTVTGQIPYRVLKQIHRDWLMTPRPEIQDRCPRELIHGSRTWIEALTITQEYRFEEGLPVVAVPPDLNSLEDGPMGRTEMVLYFDYCREVIALGWSCLCKCRNDPNTATIESERLANWIRSAGELWLESPLDGGGAAPRLMIECDRRRVPRGAGVPIQGMDEFPIDDHDLDCDCAACNMMIEGHFGTPFSSISDDHLELEDDFAFSIFETREEWSEERSLMGLDAVVVATDDDPDDSGDPPTMEDDEALSPVWRSVFSVTNVYRGAMENLQLAIGLGEILGDLQSAGAHETIRAELNHAFGDFRLAQPHLRHVAADRLAKKLESLTVDHPSLIPKVAELQNQIFEVVRSPVPTAAEADVGTGIDY